MEGEECSVGKVVMKLSRETKQPLTQQLQAVEPRLQGCVGAFRATVAAALCTFPLMDEIPAAEFCMI